MESSTIFNKSFSRYDQKKFAFAAFFGSLVMLLSILTVIRPSFNHLIIFAAEMEIDTELIKGIEAQQEKEPIPESKPKPLCNIQERRSDFCNLQGDIRIHGNSSTIYVASPRRKLAPGNEIWKLKPYARKGDEFVMSFVTELSVKQIADNQVTPRCDVNHSVPAVVFSSGGYAGNMFHDFSDILVPLFITSRQFDGEVQFLATNAGNWWFLGKYKKILSSLSRYEIIDMDKDRDVHCFPKAIVGLYQNFSELRVHPLDTPNGISMVDFREFLRSSYSLKRDKAIKISSQEKNKPRLLLIARRGTRTFTNEGDIANMAKSLGFSVVVVEPGHSDQEKFAETVNSCDVLMGVHGAGLTNLVFLPTNAIVIQILPFGDLDYMCNQAFGEPAKDMKLRYLGYKIKVEESTLIEQYPHDHPVLKDPESIAKQGWNIFKATYLNKQNVKLDVDRFRNTLLEALELLRQ